MKNEYVYILVNSKVNVIKIGKTKLHPDTRAKQLNSQTGAYGIYETYWSRKVEDCTLCERFLHNIFKKFHSHKEYFAIDAETAKQVANRAIDSFERLLKKQESYFFKRLEQLNAETRLLTRASKRLIDDEQRHERITSIIDQFQTAQKQLKNGLDRNEPK